MPDKPMEKKIFLTMSNQISGHGSFSRQQRMAEALVKKGHTVFWISPPGYKATGVTVITLSLSVFPNFAFIGLYIKLLITFIKNYKMLKSVNRVFTLREYDALCMLAIPFLRKIPKVFLSRGDTISIYKVNQPDNNTIIENLKTCAVLILYPFIQRVVLKLSDVVVVQAEFLMKSFQDRHNGINFTGVILKNDCPKVNISLCQIHDHSSDVNIKSINLAFISPLFWECKGLGVVVDAIFELEERNLNFKFHIIGDGPHKERMQNALSRSDVRDKVIWHGWLDDIGKIINSIDLVIVPSLYDSNPNLILEMISYNKPILASNIDAHKEMLFHDELLFENKNVNDLCNKIELFQSSYSNRNTFLEVLSNRKEKLSFDWEKEFINIVELSSTKRLMHKMRCLFITGTARREQSRHQLFNYMHESFNQHNIEFSILAFLESQDEPILSDSGLHVPVQSIAISLYKRSSIFQFWICMRNHHPEHLLIGGYGYIETWLALVYSIINKIPVTLWTGAGQETTESGSYVRYLLKKIFVRNVDRAITYGTNASQYLIKLGMDPSRINHGINVSNVHFFRKVLSEYLDSDEMNANLINLPKPILVFAGRLEISKGVDLLIEQLKLIPQDKYFCYFIGTGDLTEMVQECIDSKKINAKLFGFLTQSDIAKRLVEADIYILPSLNDPFSRTLSEALASGCFVLNSKYDDASYDLIREGENGYIFDPKNFNQFKYYIDMIIDSKWTRPSRRKISKSLKHDMINYAENVINSVIQSISK